MTTPATNASMFENFTKPGTAAMVCLYGNYQIGHGFIADVRGGEPCGTGVPESRGPTSGASMTEAIVKAIREMRDTNPAIITSNDRIAIFAPGGGQVAYTTFGGFTYAGNLKWESASQLTIKC